MKTVALICGGAEVRHFGLQPQIRLHRLLARDGFDVVTLSSPDDPVPEADEIVVIHGAYLYDDRLVRYLMKRRNQQLMQTSDQEAPIVAVHAPREQALPAVAAILEGRAIDSIAGLKREDPDEMMKGIPHRLLKAQRPFVVKAEASRRQIHERLLYDASYKGVTDLVTKWLWPHPARWCVQLCVRLKIQPNQVTVTGFSLMLAALFLFWRGDYAFGLVCGWIMTFFDTVDGKLARTTVSASRFGHYLDKVTDIVHPPFWYLAWGLSLTSFASPTPIFDLQATIIIIFGGYFVGRLVELFTKKLWVRGGMFVWRPIDSYFRLVTARRNTCMIPMTASLFIGRPDLGLWAVAAWTVLSTLFLMVRMIMAWQACPKGEDKLNSWLVDANPEEEDPDLAIRWFAMPSET
ncbi:MAG: CDP-alcohol phosphatidyltransferase family protein [Planctomycetota bacterium]